MKRIATDVEALHFGFGDLDAFLIDGGIEGRLHRLRSGRCNQVDDRSMVREWPAAPVLRNVAEQAMLDLIPFRGARRLTSDFDARVQGEALRIRRTPSPSTLLMRPPQPPLPRRARS
jgi:hypothetical protein